MNRPEAPRPADSGMTLIEVLVAMTLLGVVSALVVSGVAALVRTLGQLDDENRGLQDAKIIMDRMSRDIRQARGVVCDGGLADPADPTSADPNCASHLQVWIDSNSNYLKEPNEVVTWRLSKAADGEHFDVWRVVGTGAGGTPVTQKLQATSLIVRTLFKYDRPVPADATAVTLEMEYDAIVGRGVDLRHATVTTRVRNKG